MVSKDDFELATKILANQSRNQCLVGKAVFSGLFLKSKDIFFCKANIDIFGFSLRLGNSNLFILAISSLTLGTDTNLPASTSLRICFSSTSSLYFSYLNIIYKYFLMLFCLE